MDALPPIADKASSERRKRGRKPGSPKVAGSGRKAGSPNKVSPDLRQLIIERGKPIELLCDISRGVKIRVGPQAGPGATQYAYPSMQERAAAAKILIDKILPSSGGLSPAAGGKGTGERPEEDPSNLDVARRIAFALGQGVRSLGGDDVKVTPLRPAPREPAPQVSPPAPPEYIYPEPSAEELGRLEFDQHINRAAGLDNGRLDAFPVARRRPEGRRP